MESQSIKQSFLAIAACLSFVLAWGQHPLTDQIILQYEKDKNVEQAIQRMGAVVEKEGQDPLPHFTMGFLLKEQFKKNPPKDKQFQWREKAMIAFDEALKRKPDDKLKDNINYAQRYIVSTYYNDALMQARGFQMGNEAAADAAFDYFKSWNQKLKDPQSLGSLHIEFKKKKAERYYEFWEQSDTSLVFPNHCIALYQEILKEDPTDCESLHNLAILYYNIGVFNIKKIDGDIEMDQLLQIQEEALRLFARALPFAQNTFQDCPKNASQYKALMFIHRSLGNDEEYKRLKVEAQNLYPNE